MPRIAVAPDCQLHYELHGSGPTVLFLGATAYPGAIWEKYQVPALRDDLQLLIHDYRGVGQSDRPNVAYSTAMFAADAIGLLDALGLGRVHVLGHSMGGRVAQLLALDYPERVKSLILFGSGPGSFEGSDRWTRGIPLNMAVAFAKQGFEGYQRHHVCDTDAVFGGTFRAAHPEIVAEAFDVIYGALPSIKCYLRHVIARQEHQTTERLGEIRCPALVVVGSEDDEAPSHIESSQVLARGIPGAEFVLLPNRGHLHFWEDPAQSNTLILDWVRRQER